MLHRFTDSQFLCFREVRLCNYLILCWLGQAPQLHSQNAVF
jgi:hypothetical protein